MTTLQFLTGIWSWLMGDWTHPIVAAAAFTAVTPTPQPGTFAAKVYAAVDTIALNVLQAKSKGENPVTMAEQIAIALAEKKAAEVQPATTDKVQS